MSFPHEVIAACPVLTDTDKALIRAMATRRFEYCLDPSESAEDFTAVDPDAGTLPLYLKQNNVSFQLDPLDEITEHDGVTCLVTSDTKRYKSESIDFPHSVLDKDTSAQPALPSVNDRYLIPVAATGTDWAGKDGKIGIYTSAGWRFAIVPLGRFVYVEDETAFYHRNTAGTWTPGVGSIALAGNSVALSALIGTGIRSILKVENQTTNTPPGSPTVANAFVIGPSPTGVWASKPGQVAHCEATGVWTYYVPATGDRVYDKALGIDVRWSGSAWVSAAGAFVNYGEHRTVGTGSVSQLPSSAANLYTYSNTVAPTTSHYRTVDSVTHTITSRSGAKLRFHYECDITQWNTTNNFGGGLVAGNQPPVIALFRDNLADAVAWQRLGVAADRPLRVTWSCVVDVVDANPHEYRIAIVAAGIDDASDDADYAAGLQHRLFEYMETA
jgi:hypothetical protein